MTGKVGALELAERCEATTGPSDELQFAIGDAVGATIERAPFDGAGRGVRDCPPYTHSLDAAMTLVPEGWGYCFREDGERHFARLHSADFRSVTWGKGSDWITDVVSGREVVATAATLPLAICAAALRAIAQPKASQ